MTNKYALLYKGAFVGNHTKCPYFLLKRIVIHELKKGLVINEQLNDLNKSYK